MAAIRGSGKSGQGVEKLTKRVDDLTTQNRKLRERLDKLEARISPPEE